jgi:hypothetical protein
MRRSRKRGGAGRVRGSKRRERGQVRDWVPRNMADKRGSRIRKGPGMPCVN